MQSNSYSEQSASLVYAEAYEAQETSQGENQVYSEDASAAKVLLVAVICCNALFVWKTQISLLLSLINHIDV